MKSSINARRVRGIAIAVVLAVAPATRRGMADEPDPAMAIFDQPIQRAVDSALEYLAEQQQSDGAWPSGFGSTTGITSLCVMAFLSAGHTPGQQPYGATIQRGLDYVLAHARADGMIIDKTSHGPMYCHGISTLLLCEVTGMVDPARQEKIDAALPRALAVILAAQAVNKNPRDAGGWRYQPNSQDSDISCAGWQLLSLRAARNCGAPVPVEAIDRAIAYIERCANRDGGFAYQPGQPSGFARTGVGVLCLELTGRHHVPLALAGGNWMLRYPQKQFGGEHYYYGLYYGAQAAFQLGGNYWMGFAGQAYPLLLRHQKPDGSWPSGSSMESKPGPCYSTAMSVLSLTVTYRQLPIYQR